MTNYSDIEDANLGRQVRGQMEQEEMLNQSIGQQEAANQLERENIDGDPMMAQNQQVMGVLGEMQDIESKGGDPMEYLQSLPEDVQQQVIEMMQSEQQADEELNQENPEQDVTIGQANAL